MNLHRYPITLTALALAAAVSAAAEFHVASTGSDANPGTSEKPFATPARAMAAVRTLVAHGLKGDVRVVLHGGIYALEGPWVFTPADSGSADHAITYAAAPGEAVVISGGRAITTWKPGGGSKWTAELAAVRTSGWFFRQLIVNDQRAVRARWPDEDGVLHLATVSDDVKSFTFDRTLPQGDLGGQDAELVVYENWAVSRALITASDEHQLATATAVGWIGHGDMTTASPGKPAFIEHARAALDQPGEWFLDRRTGSLTYLARPGETPAQTVAVAPVLTQLVRIAGTKDRPVRNLRFEGLRFEHTDFALPSMGYSEIQAAHFGPSTQQPTAVQPVAIECVYAEEIRFERCRLAHLNNSGIGFGPGCRRNTVMGCLIEDIGGNGVMVGWRGAGQLAAGTEGTLDADWAVPADAPVGHTIANCVIRRCGADSRGAVGVFVAFSADTRVAHNVIHDLPYTGVSVGYRWDPTPTSQVRCLVEYNHIYDVMKKLADGGGVYTLGFQPGTVLRGNLIHDVHRSAYAHGGAPNNGFFIDEGSKGFLFESNVVHTTSGDSVRFNQCQRDWHTWQGNAFDGDATPARIAEAEARAGLEPVYRTLLHPAPALPGIDAALTAWSADPPAAPATPVQVNYARPFEPPTRPAFLALPPGAVEPAGWLRDWCLAARDGFTGHMDDYDVEFKRAWAADHQMTGERLNWPNGGWPYEGGGYWFDGLARLGYALHDDALIQQAKRRLDVVVTHMNPNSILFLWWLDRSRPEDRNGSLVSDAWPMWANGLLGRALAGFYAASKDPQVLRALEAAYGGDRDWLRLGWAMSNPWPAFDTYTWTGNAGIAAGLTALFSPDGGGLSPGGNSWNRYRHPPDPKPGAEANDHVVHFLESTTPWALGYLWTGNREFLETTLAWHDLLEREAMQPSGVPVADEFYGPTGAFRGTETCDVAAYLWSQLALLTISGQGRLADRAERAFLNAGPVTVARDFKTHVYFQCPNRVVDLSPPHPHGPQAKGNSYQPKHYPLCCTAALNRIAPNYVMHLWMATYDNGLAATCYGPCRVSALAADRVPVDIVCQTDYPFDDVIVMNVKPERSAVFPLALRIPGWCKRATLSVNGTPLDATPDVRGFVSVKRLWKPGDTIRLQLPMAPAVMSGRDRNAQDAPYAAVSYGPLLFALPIPEAADSNTPDPAAKWRYALDVQEPGLVVERAAMPARWDWPLAAPVRLRANAVEIDWNPDPKAPRLPAEPVGRSKPTQSLTLVPYGCTRFRISMFPVAGHGSNTVR